MAGTTPPVSAWHRLLAARVSRRDALRRGAGAVAGAALLPLRLEAAEPAPDSAAPARAGDPAARGRDFSPIRPTTDDDLVLPEGYEYDVLRAYGDDAGRGRTFGYNNDFLAFFPIDLFDPRRGADAQPSSGDGLLVVNHEYPNPLLQHGHTDGPKTPDQVRVERSSLGVSVLRVRRGDGGKWAFVPDDRRNRRVDGYTECALTGPAAGRAAVGFALAARGTVGNCSGGVTPWGTVLSCEENVDEYAEPVADGGYGWDPEEFHKSHYGWIVELDPFNPDAPPKKRTAMGRFRHENVAVRVRPDGRVVAYMGDDKKDACVYRFVSKGAYDPKDRGANMDLLEDGDLYAADFAKGKWVLLVYEKQKVLQDARGDDGLRSFRGQADVLADARSAALALKATPVDRPEDIEIHPQTGEVYVALTNNDLHGNYHGQIIRFRERDDDPDAFAWEFFAVGGPQSGFSSPDNLAFDPDGNLWMVTDVSSKVAGRGIYQFQGNNAVFVFPTAGPEAGKAKQFASGPVQCELTGPCWTPDGTTLFLAVQHPGEETSDPANPTSRWPGGRGPLPAVVAITGFAPFAKPSLPFHGAEWAAAPAEAAADAGGGQ